MKYIYILPILMICFLFSCKEEANHPVDDKSQGLATLEIAEAKELIPLKLYRESLKLVFINQEKEEKILTIKSINEGLKEKKVEGSNYFSEDLQIDITEANRSDYRVNIVATANYYSIDGHFGYLAFISCQILTTINNGHIPSIGIDSNGEPALCRLEKEIQLLDKTFHDVYTNYTIESLPAFSEIYYTVAQGLVAFTDENNTLWVLDRME